jgi:hypothetical protein
MRLLDHEPPIDPEIAATLDAIDAVLAGDPVDARYAEVAEIALLLASDRPAVASEFAQSMDERVARRFAPAPGPEAAEAARRRRVWSGFWQASGALAAAAALVVAIVIVAGGAHLGSSANTSSAVSSGAAAGSSAASTSSSAAASSAPAHAAPRPERAAAAAASSNAQASGSSAPQTLSAVPGLQPPTSGRKVVQSAQLQLAAAANRIDDVAQEVYDVVGALNGIVVGSTVTQTGGTGGYADFQLSIPSGSLGQAMSRLSSLNYAVVVSRTDSSQDITDQYGAAQRSLADARALRTSLLKQLAGATTTEQIDSLKTQIRDAEASISSDQATLNRLNRQVNFSQVSLEINARSVPPPTTHGGGGFGIGRAAHDAGRVLTVAAGVSLIALAALTPIALLVALAWWVSSALRRRRREQALDAA